MKIIQHSLASTKVKKRFNDPPGALHLEAQHLVVLIRARQINALVPKCRFKLRLMAFRSFRLLASLTGSPAFFLALISSPKLTILLKAARRCESSEVSSAEKSRPSF